MNEKTNKIEKQSKRIIISWIGSICLTIMFIFYIVFHFFFDNEVQILNSDSFHPFEQAWLSSLSDGGGKNPDIPKDSNGNALESPDQFTKWLFSPDKELDEISGYRSFFIYFNSDSINVEKGRIPYRSVLWENMPSSLKEYEKELFKISDSNLFSATIGHFFLSAQGRPEPWNQTLYWAQRQATSLLDRGYRSEGKDLLELLEPYLSGIIPEFDTWMGSAMIMLAIDADTGLEKMSLVDKGVAYLEESMEKGRINSECHYIRAITYLSLPEFFSDLRSSGIDSLEIITEKFIKGESMISSNSDLEPEKLLIDSLYLLSIIDFAQSQTGLSDSDYKRIKTMKKNIGNYKRGDT